MPTALLDRRLLVVTGKGGVGKTAVAAALALASARAGRRTLICELDARGDVAAALGVPRPGFDAVGLRADHAGGLDVGEGSLWHMEMSTEASLREYVKLQLRIPLIARLGPLASTFDFVADAAPGVREILSIGKVAWDVREQRYDLVIVDAPSSGYVVGYLNAPTSIRELVQVGLIRGQTEWMLEILGDPAVTGAVVVTTPDEMPVTESLELIRSLRTETVVDTAAVIVNRVLPELFTHREEALFERLTEPRSLVVLAAAAGQGVTSVLAAARLNVALRRRGSTHLTRLVEGISDVPVMLAPEQFGANAGPALTAALSASLVEELG